MQNITNIFSANMKAKRRALGLTQKDLAQKVGYSEKAVSKWETGVALPPSFLLPILAQTLETSIDELMTPSEGIKYYLGIDGGGSKTEFILANADGKILHQIRLGPSNPTSIGSNNAREILKQGITEVIGEYPCNSISVCVGLAGAGFEGEKLEEFLRRFGFAKIVCGGDGDTALSVCLQGEKGIIVIMGTGSVAYAKYNGQTIRAGGYGHFFHDFGSGFSLGRDAIFAALQEEDGSGPPSLLHEYVAKKCGSDVVLEKLADFYSGGKQEIAKYASLVFDAYAAGDTVATEILKNNMNAVAKMIHGVASHFEEQTVRVVLCGGIATAHALFIPILEKLLDDDNHRYDLSVCDKPMAYGALYLAGMPYPKEP